MASFDSFNAEGVDQHDHNSRPFDDDASMETFDPNIQSQHYDSTGDIFAGGAPPPSSQQEMHHDNPPRSPDVYGFGISTPNADYVSPFESAMPDANENGKIHGEDDGGIFVSDGPILPDPSEMREEGTKFREWRQQNAIHLEEKENREKEMRKQIINEAEEYIRSFYEKRQKNCETTKAQNREREKLYLANQEKFHKEADQHYWKAIAELIPREVPNIEKKRMRKDPEKKPSITVIQGPKPGKPTELARMRQLFVKLKQNPPTHMMPKPAQDGKDAKDGKDGKDSKDGKDGMEGKEGKDVKDIKNSASTAKEAAGNKPASTGKGSAADGIPEKSKSESGAEVEQATSTEQATAK